MIQGSVESKMHQEDLLDNNLYNMIAKCFINNKHLDSTEIFVIYEDGNRERIWTFNPTQCDFNHREFIGKTKIEAVFYCDRKSRHIMI